jgi:hypothetical protein
MSAGGYLDGCGFIPASGGTGDFVVSAAVQGYQTPASAGAVNSTVYTYRAESADKSQWEIGFGAYTTSSTTLARTTVLASSTGSKVSFSAAPNVFVTAAKADLQNASLLTSGTSTALFGDQTYKTLAAIAQSGSASDLATGTVPTNLLSLSQITASLSADVALNNTASFFDGPTIAQGNGVGVWFVCGTVTLVDNAGGAVFNIKLWDGTTVISSGRAAMTTAGFSECMSVSGLITAPAGNLRISVNDPNSTSGFIKANGSGIGKDSTITAFRLH